MNNFFERFWQKLILYVGLPEMKIFGIFAVNFNYFYN